MSHDTPSSNNQQHEKNIIRVKHDTDNPYVMLNRQAMRDHNLSLDTLGLWVRLLCNRDDWVIHISQLMKINNIGRDKVYRMLKELLKFGYAHCYQDRSHGKFGGTHWVIFESSKTPEEIQKMFPNTENPYTDKPDTANPPQRNSIDISNTNNNIYAPPSGDAKPPPPSLSVVEKIKSSKTPKTPFRTVHLKERMSGHALAEKFKNYFNTPLVGIDDQDHQELVTQYGEKIVSDAYSCLAEWKLSKAEKKPKVLGEHTDLARLKKWAIKEVMSNPTAVKGLGSHRAKWAIEADTKPLEPMEKRAYAWGMKSTEKEEELMAYLTKVKKKDTRLSRMSVGTVEELEKEMMEYLKSKGIEHVVDSL